jgi:hypothetical protein
MPPRPRRPASFVEHHGLWSDAQAKAAEQVERIIKKEKLEVVRFSFADQHGVLRGKTLLASEAANAMRAGVTMTTTLLAKDTAHRTVYPVFTPGGGFAMTEMQGGGDFVMVADPSTFRILPWANKTGWMLCDIYFTNGKPVPYSTRARCRDALATLAKAGFDFLAGLEVEFYLFKLENPRLAPADATWPPEAPDVSLLTQGGRDYPALDRAAGLAVALGRNRAWPKPVRIYFSPAGWSRRRRRHGLVSRSGETDCAPQRLSGELHVPACIAECNVEWLASAPVAGRNQNRAQRLHLRSPRRALHRRQILSGRPARPRACCRRLHHTDHQWLQALSAQFARA